MPAGADISFGFDLTARLVGVTCWSHDRLFVVDAVDGTLVQTLAFNGSAFSDGALPRGARMPSRAMSALHDIVAIPGSEGVWIFFFWIYNQACWQCWTGGAGACRR